MSNMPKPIFVELFETAHNRLHALVAQQVPRWQNEMSPESLKIFGRDIWEAFERSLAELREVHVDMGRGLETIKDLQLAKDPDVERVAQEIVTHRGATPQEAFNMAEKFVQYRNWRRSQERAGLPTSGQPPAAVGVRR